MSLPELYDFFRRYGNGPIRSAGKAVLMKIGVKVRLKP
jgi:hypothetical protein